MDLLSEPTNNYIFSTYIVAGSFLIVSLAYILCSENHKLTWPLLVIYILEIIS